MIESNCVGSVRTYLLCEMLFVVVQVNGSITKMCCVCMCCVCVLSNVFCVVEGLVKVQVFRKSQMLALGVHIGGAGSRIHWLDRK